MNGSDYSLDAGERHLLHRVGQAVRDGVTGGGGTKKRTIALKEVQKLVAGLMSKPIRRSKRVRQYAFFAATEELKRLHYAVCRNCLSWVYVASDGHVGVEHREMEHLEEATRGWSAA